jgi:hypothetical protein
VVGRLGRAKTAVTLQKVVNHSRYEVTEIDHTCKERKEFGRLWSRRGWSSERQRIMQVCYVLLR